MDKKRISLLIIAFLTIIIFISSDFEIPFVNADTKSFELKDGFETFIENKVYTEEENLTIPEYFCEEKGDCCDFTEDIEGFVYQTQAGTTAQSINYGNGKLLINVTSDIGFNYFYVMYKISNLDLSLIHYDYLEVKAKVDFDDYNPKLFFGNHQYEYFPQVADRFQLTTEFQTFYHKIDINTIYYENSTNLMLIVRDDGNSILEYEYYRFQIDYIKFWRNNITDYATSLDESIKDSWDYSEGDDENIETLGNSGFEVDIIHNGYYEIEEDETGVSFRISESNMGTFDINEYKYVYMVIYSNISQTSYCRTYDFSKVITYTININVGWGLYEYIPNFDWVGNKGFGFRFNGANMHIKVSFIGIFRSNLEDKVFLQSQNTSFYRASTGLYSFYHKIDKNYTFYEDFTVNLNSSIKIAIPSLSMFPQKISFNIFSNSNFNISFFIGTQEFILYEKTNINMWINIRRTINRENYLVNETETELYFKIYSENQFINNYLEYYLDDLYITYTEPREFFEYDYDTNTGEYLNHFDINVTDNFFKGIQKGIVINFNSETMGINYNTSSNILHSRRSFTSYSVETDNSRIETNIYQYSTFGIDKEYLIISNISVVSVLDNPIDQNYLYSKVNLTNNLFVDGVNQNINSKKTIIDFFFEGYFNFKYEISIVQEDYNTISLTSDYLNIMTGNITNSEPFAFQINTGNMKNALNSFNICSSTIFKPLSHPPLSIFPSSSNVLVKITRDITHTDIIAENPDLDIPDNPIWDAKHPFKSLWNWFKHLAIMLWESVKGSFLIFLYIGKIFENMVHMGLNIGNMAESIVSGFGEGGVLGNMFGGIGDIFTELFSGAGILGGIFGGIGNIFDGITNIFSFLGGDLGDWIGNFFDNILNPFSGWFDNVFGDFGFLSGTWDGLLSGFASDDWGNMPGLWGGIFPAFDMDFLNLWSGSFGNFYFDFFGFDFVALFEQIKEFFEILAMVITILLIIYLIHLFKLAGSRDWDRFRIEISGIINGVIFVISAIVKIIHWIFEVIWALLDVLIPFT